MREKERERERGKGEIDKDMYVAGDRVGWSSIIEGNVVFILSS